MAQKSSAVPELWARCLLGHCYGLWFLYLPTLVRAAPAKLRALQLAYDVLRKMEQHKVVLPDEVGQLLLRDPPGKEKGICCWDGEGWGHRAGVSRERLLRETVSAGGSAQGRRDCVGGWRRPGKGKGLEQQEKGMENS